MQTFRRLNDPEKYYGLSWRGWLGAAAAGGVLYLAVRFSPLGTKPTISLTVIVLALAASVLYGLSGQALGPGRFAMAVIRYARHRRPLTVPAEPDGPALVLTSPPPAQAARHGRLDSEIEEVFL